MPKTKFEEHPKLQAVWTRWTSRPDWRNSSSYPTPEGALQWWGFEFRRRSPEWQEQLSALLGRLATAGYDSNHFTDDGLFSFDCYRELFPEWNGIDNWPHAPQWAICRPKDLTICFAEDETAYVHAHPERMDHEVLVFNLNFPITRQIKRAQAVLIERQQAKVQAKRIVGPANLKNRDDRLPIYLRVLDARDGSPRVTFAEIADVLSTADKTLTENDVGYWYKKACEYRDRAFAELLKDVGFDE